MSEKSEELGKALYPVRPLQAEPEILKTELLSVREELQETRDKYVVYYDFAPVGYVSLNNKGVILEVNLTLSELLGCEKQRLTGSAITPHIEPNSQETFNLFVNNTLSTGVRQNCEIQMKGRDNAVWTAGLESTAVRDADGNFSQCNVTVTDITERKKIEEQSRYHIAVAEFSPYAVVAADKSLNIIIWNKVAEAIFGWNHDEVIGDGASPQIRSQILVVLTRDEVMKHLADHGSWTGKSICGKKDGSQAEINLTINVIWNNQGDFDGIVLAYHSAPDSLERSRVSDEAVIEKKVKERTEELSNSNRILQQELDIYKQAKLSVKEGEINEYQKAQEQVQRSLQQLQKTIKEIIQAMAYIGEVRDPYTAGHQRRVAHLSFEIARKMGLNNEQYEGLTMAAFVHDVGKILVPADILSKPGKLTKPEFDMIKEHTRVGYEILKNIEFPWPIAKIVLQHHERLDGSGYPFGLSGEQITVEARILAVADVVEAMSSHRPYRPALGIEKALEEIKANRGTLYDSTVVDTCIKIFNDKTFSLN